MKYLFLVAVLSTSFEVSHAQPTEKVQSAKFLFNGHDLEQWDFADGAWVIDEDGSLTCEMDKVKQKNGSIKVRSKGYIWTKQEFDNFELALSYKLSPAANTGVFFRTDKANPVQGGFEIQLIDNEGFQQLKGKKDPRNLNGAFYDCQAATKHSQNPIGEWNTMKLTCNAAIIEVEINGDVVNKADISQWNTANSNPDGSPNKFKTALNKLPQNGRIGLQNHGNKVWFKDVTVRPL